MSEQDKQAICGNWTILSNFSIGKLYVTTGLNNSYMAMLQYNSYNEETLTNVKL